MEIDSGQLPAHQRYKRMTSLSSLHRAAADALVTTLGANGVANAAPFSMFNMLGQDPPIGMLSINRLHDGQIKDTAANILRPGEFVVRICDEAMTAQMHKCGEAFWPEISELEQVGLHVVPSQTIAPLRIAKAPAAFECVLHEKLVTESRIVYIGRVTWLSGRGGLVDVERWRVRLQSYHPVGRFGARLYVKTGDRFAIRGAEAGARTTTIDEI